MAFLRILCFLVFIGFCFSSIEFDTSCDKQGRCKYTIHIEVDNETLTEAINHTTMALDNLLAMVGNLENKVDRLERIVEDAIERANPCIDNCGSTTPRASTMWTTTEHHTSEPTSPPSSTEMTTEHSTMHSSPSTEHSTSMHTTEHSTSMHTTEHSTMHTTEHSTMHTTEHSTMHTTEHSSTMPTTEMTTTEYVPTTTSWNCEKECKHGTCVSGSNGTETCACFPGWSGEDCDIPSCTDVTCGEHAHCHIVDNRTWCFCDPGYTGTPDTGCKVKWAQFCASGDPHQTTFDGRHFSYQGTCPYVVAKPCNDSMLQPDTPDFEVIFDSYKHRKGDPVAYMNYAEIHVDGEVVRLTKDRQLYVNGNVIDGIYLNQNLRRFAEFRKSVIVI